MNVFGIGVLELLFVLVVALIVLGPERMTQTARTLGKYIREIQRATAEIPRLISLDDDPPSSPSPQRQQLPARGQPAGEPDSSENDAPQDEPPASGPSDSTPRS